jgi:pimeloyl-ACP methyl ester carboxylesterase
MARAKANGIEIEYETAGRKDDPTLLLIHGLGAQLTLWPDELFEGLARRGLHVVRFDNRDIGLSSDFSAAGVPNMMEAFAQAMRGEQVAAPYMLSDMAADAMGLLDALGIDRAHIVGASMGGMIAQIVAATHTVRTKSLVTIYSTTGRPGLPPARPEAFAALTALPEGPSREQRVAHGIKLRRAIGSPGIPIPEARLRADVERNVDRRWFPEGAARQMTAIMASGDRVELCKTIKAPTLVLHGEDDPLVPVDGGRDIAALVPGARLHTIPGWGHDFPPQLVPELVDRIATFCKSV